MQVTFIRHAESEENVRVRALCELVRAVGCGQLPSLQSARTATGLLTYDIDSQLTTLGKRQAADMNMILESKAFWERNIDCIVHSPLIRATETCLAIVPGNLLGKVTSLDILSEITPYEQLSKATIRRRVTAFEDWLARLPAGTSHVVVVGHCQYFNSLLGMKTLMRNCDVWRSQVAFVSTSNDGSTRTSTWAPPVLLYRSALSQAHPIGRVYKALPWLRGWSSWGPEPGEIDEDSDDEAAPASGSASRRATSAAPRSSEVEDDLTDEPVCRICQARQSETPGQRMLRPCLCSGSVSYVHLDCLNRWRATSTSAYFTCSVCRYPYHIQRTLIARMLTHEYFILGSAVAMVFALCFALGLVLSGALHYFKLSIDPVREVLELMQLDRYWMRCLLSNRYSPARSLPQRGGGDFAAALQGIYSASSVSVLDKLRALGALLQSPLPLQYFLCHRYTAAVLNVFLLGAVPVGCVGFLGYFVGALNDVRAGGGGFLMQVGLVITWLASLGVRAISRLCLVVGCAIATREVYTYLLGKARTLSQRFGDMILEPHR